MQKSQLLRVEADLNPVLYVYADRLAARIDNGERPAIEWPGKRTRGTARKPGRTAT